MESNFNQIPNDLESEEKFLAEQEEVVETSLKRKKKTVLISICAIIVVLLGICAVVLLPKYSHYSKANRALEEKNYEVAIEEYSLIESFMDSENRRQEAYIEYARVCAEDGSYEKMLELLDHVGQTEETRTIIIESAEKCAEKNAFADMITILGSVEQTQDVVAIYTKSAEKCIGEKKYGDAVKIIKAVHTKAAVENLWKACGVGYIEEEKYSDAVEALNQLSDSESKRYCAYALAKLDIQQGKFESAISNLTTAAGILDSEDLVKNVYYSWGKSQLSNDLDSARKHLVAAGEYRDAKELVTACDFLSAEELLKAGKYSEALSAYKQLPTDFSYNGSKVSDRINLLNSSASLINATGTWTATYNYIESRNIYKRNGSWDNWYIDETDTSQKVTIEISLNDNGTFDLEGTVNFYRFTSFSSLSQYCNATKTSRRFSAKNIQSLPSSFDVGSDATLTYSNGVFVLKYSVRDDYSVSFYNMYNSTVKYGKHE